MNYVESPYFHISHARDLQGWDKFIFRLLEILPGFLTWGTFALIILLSIYKPIWAAIFIIAFDLYWLLKTVHLGFHHYYNWRRLKNNIKVDWQKMIQNLKYEHLYHLIILPFYKEDEFVVEQTIKSLVSAKYKTSKMLIVLAAEQRAGVESLEVAQKMVKKYQKNFAEIIYTVHPADLPNEIVGKGPNISFAAEEARVKILDQKKIQYQDVIVSAFDIDTVIWPGYLACLTWHFLTTENPHKMSFQPVPLYNNNIWEVPAISRVAAMTSTFWQMIQQERVEKLVTFSSHSLSFKSLYEVNYWQRNMISDDSRIFWNLYLANNGDYGVVPLSYPVSMDANLAPGFFKTFKNIYKQHLRWMWGVENIPYIIFNFIKNKKIPLKKKIHQSVIQLEGFWSLATNPIMILVLGWLPIVLGGDAFRNTVLSYNLPNITRDLMTITTLGLILSAIIAATMLPPMPKEYKKRKRRWIIMVLQWILVPFTIIVFGSLPGIHAQTRLMFGKYIGAFWNTPKHRKNI
jgi:cellulose synthase/poly-beta-1,6-N-acetylglucosamine synthase-like glycosyltransferase